MTIGVKNRKTRHYGEETKDYLGTIYWDSSYKDTLYGRPRAHNCFRAEIIINRKVSRFRSHDYGTCEMWLRMKTVEKLAAEGKPTRETIPPEVMKSIADFGEWLKFKGFAKHSAHYYMWRIKAICWVVGELSKEAAERFMESDRCADETKIAKCAWNKYCEFLKREEWKI